MHFLQHIQVKAFYYKPHTSNWPIFQFSDPLVITNDPFYLNGSTLIPAWISHYIHYKVWDETTYPFPNFNSPQASMCWYHNSWYIFSHIWPHCVILLASVQNVYVWVPEPQFSPAFLHSSKYLKKASDGIIPLTAHIFHISTYIFHTITT